MSTKKKTVRIATAMLRGVKYQVYVGDFGYGFLKDAGGVTPMAIAETTSNNRSKNVFKKDGKHYIFGEEAVDDAIPTSVGFSFFREYVQYFVPIRLKELGYDLDAPILIKTGMTILDSKGNNAESFIRLLKNMDYLNDNDEVKKIKTEVQLFAQGQGILFDYYSNSKEILSESGQVIIFDLGTRSFEFMTYIDGVYQPQLSWADALGSTLIITKLQAYLISISKDEEISESETMEAFNDGVFFSYGKEVDISEKCNDLKEEYINTLVEKLQSIAKKTYRKTSKIILGGGGANIATIKKFKEQNPVIFATLENPPTPYQLSNYRGYTAGAKLAG